LAKPENISGLCAAWDINLLKFPISIISSAKLEELKESAKKAEQKASELFSLLDSQRGLAETVLKSMTEGVLAVDQNGRIILANPAIEKMFNRIEPEILGKTIREGLLNNEIADLIDEAVKLDKTVSREIKIVFPVEGSFMAIANPMRKGTGERAGVVCVLHDITEIRKLEMYRSEFMANVSHELKTPLTAIRSYAETLINGAVNDKEHNLEFLKKIDKHALNLSALIDDQLEISKLESKKELGPFTRVDILKTISHAAETITEKAKKKNISIEKNISKRECFVSGMEDHIYRAVLNLLDNAVNYTADYGRVEISCVKKDDKIEITVTDNGIGIPKEHLPRIFERFYRVDKARSRELGGTGLGLAIVKHVANIHNGTVSVESEENKGSVFTINLPSA